MPVSTKFNLNCMESRSVMCLGPERAKSSTISRISVGKSMKLNGWAGNMVAGASAALAVTIACISSSHVPHDGCAVRWKMRQI